jgi:hypothetical protein
VAMVLDELKQLQPKPFPDGQFRTGQYIRIFFEYGRGNVRRPGLVIARRNVVR